MPNKESVASRLKKRGIEEWEIRNAADTLMRAEEIKNDKDLMAEVNKEIQKRRDALEEIATGSKKK